jgi:hypothetical protein
VKPEKCALGAPNLLFWICTVRGVSVCIGIQWQLEELSGMMMVVTMANIVESVKRLGPFLKEALLGWISSKLKF